MWQHQQPAHPLFSNEQIVGVLVSLAAQLEHTPSKNEYERWRSGLPKPETTPSSDRISKRFKTWAGALEAAELPIPKLTARAAVRRHHVGPQAPRGFARDKDHWKEDGCDWFASCFTCPLTMCRYDYEEPGDARREAMDCEGFLLKVRPVLSKDALDAAETVHGEV